MFEKKSDFEAGEKKSEQFFFRRKIKGPEMQEQHRGDGVLKFALVLLIALIWISVTSSGVMGQPLIGRSQVLNNKQQTTTARMLTPCEAKLSKLVNQLQKYIYDLPKTTVFSSERENLQALLKGYEQYEDVDAKVVHSVAPTVQQQQPPRPVQSETTFQIPTSQKTVQDHLAKLRERQDRQRKQKT